MSESRRVQKVEKEVRQIVANYLLGGFKDPLNGLVSVSRVMANKDLRSAKIFVSVMGTEPDLEEENISILQNRSGDIQREVSKHLRMRYCPKLTFILDRSTEQILKIDKILHEINSSQES